MADEKKIKAEELSDEQLNEAAGGNASNAGDSEKKLKKCANLNCCNMLPYDDPSDLCQKCRESASRTPSIHHGFSIVEDQFNRK